MITDAVGYAAGAAVVATFCMTSMLWLRILAIASNVLFITYGVMAVATPVLVLHLVLLPLNMMRLREQVLKERARMQREPLPQTHEQPVAGL